MPAKVRSEAICVRLSHAAGHVSKKSSPGLTAPSIAVCVIAPGSIARPAASAFIGSVTSKLAVARANILIFMDNTSRPGYTDGYMHSRQPVVKQSST